MVVKKNIMGFMTVDYEDGDVSTYKGLKLTFGDTVKIFNTGDPLIDWYDYSKYVYNGKAVEDGVNKICRSSNVNHWFMDTDEYVEKYLKMIDSENYDFINLDDISKLSISDINKYPRCVIAKDMKNFQDLKRYYKLHKNK